MTSIKNGLGKLTLIGLLALSVISCKKDKNDAADPTESKYSAVLCVGSWPNTAYYIADVPSLTEGTISIVGNGAELTGKVYAQDVIQKNGFYYHANSGSGRIGKYHTENGKLVTDKEVSFSWLDWSAYTWADDETLVIFGTNGDGDEARYAVVKVATMAITTGTLNLEAIPSGLDTYALSFAQYRNGKLFVGYGFGSSDFTNYPNMITFKKAFVAVVDYANMTVEKSIQDSRTSMAGGPNVYAPSSFLDENNDLYIISDPVYGYDYESPSVVYRIKNGSTDFDPTYFFNFSAATNNAMGPAFWYIGNGKAIVRTRIAGQSIDAEHSFSLVDVKTGTFIKKLDLPADKGERMVQAVIVEDGKAYIAVNAADRDFIWEYDPATDKLTKGAEFTGGIDYILRLEKVK